MRKRLSAFRPLTLSIRARKSLISAIIFQLDDLEDCDRNVCALSTDESAQYLDLCSVLIALKSPEGARFLKSYNSRRGT